MDFIRQIFKTQSAAESCEKEKKQLLQDVEDLKNGHDNKLPTIYQRLTSKNYEIRNLAAKFISEYMGRLTYAQIIKLSDSFRHYTSMDWYVNWKEVNPNAWRSSFNSEDFLWVVRLGTFHPNGFYRQNCLRELKNDPKSLGFVLLRCNDWVASIRSEATRISYELLNQLTGNEISYLPFLEKLYRSARCDSTDLERLDEKFASGLYAIGIAPNWSGIARSDVLTRVSLYHLLLRRNKLNKEDYKYILQREKNGQCLRSVVASFLNTGYANLDDINELLKSRSVIIQRKAIEKKYELLGDCWDGLEELLISPSKGIREYVRYILQCKSDIDIKQYYVEHLGDESDSRKAICILGIGEIGEAKDAIDLLQYLKNGNTRIVRNALHSIGLLDPHTYSETYWEYLHDSRVEVMGQAYREIRKYHIKYGAERIYQALQTTDSLKRKRKLAILLKEEKCWDRVPYLLMLYWHEDEEVRKTVYYGLRNRTMYASISRKKADWINEILQDSKYNIPEDVKKSITFDLKYVTQ